MLPWRRTRAIARWLARRSRRAVRLLRAANRSTRPAVFTRSTNSGEPIAAETARPLHATTRMAHCFAIAHCSDGRPGAADFVDHAIAAIWTRHRDPKHGGYFWSFDADGPRERDKLAYGHAFVLLAAVERQMRRPSRRRPADRRHLGSAGDALLGGKRRRQRRGVPRGLVAVQRLSRPELQHAPDRGADGGVRGDGRAELSRQGGEHRRA